MSAGDTERTRSARRQNAAGILSPWTSGSTEPQLGVQVDLLRSMLSHDQYRSPSPGAGESDLSWYPGASSTGGTCDVTNTQKLAHRRAKRVIPDEEKDEKYWEKRKRNNMAAKRSRENKRQMEIDIRHKVGFLEEDNALLRREMLVIKSRFGLPLDRSILTPEERAQCLQEVKNAQAVALESQAFKVEQKEGGVSSTFPGMYSVSAVAAGHGDSNDLNRTGMEHERSDFDSRKGQVNGQGKPVIKEEPPLEICSESAAFVPKVQQLHGQFVPAVLWGAFHPPGTGLHDGYPASGLDLHQQLQQQQQEQQHHHRMNCYSSGSQQSEQTKRALVTNTTPPGMSSPCYAFPSANVRDSPAATASAAGAGHAVNSHHSNARTPYDYFMAAAYTQGQAAYGAASNRPSALAAMCDSVDFSMASRGGKVFRQDFGRVAKKNTPQDTAMTLPNGRDLGCTRVERHDVMAAQRDHSFRSPVGVASAAGVDGMVGRAGGLATEGHPGFVNGEAKQREKELAPSGDLRLRVLTLASQLEHVKKRAMD